LRETANQRIDGFVSRTTYSAAQRIRLRAGDHVGYRFTLGGDVLRTEHLSLRRGVLADSLVSAVINGVRWWRLSGGALDGYWIEQSAAAYRRGTVSKLSFALPPRVDVAAGTYTAYSFDWLGRVRDSVTAGIGSTTAIRVSAWAVINGTPRYLVVGGPWAGMWLAETSATRLHV
jgi:hypothetical protein